MWPSPISSAMALLLASTGVTASSMKLERLNNFNKRAVTNLPLVAVHERLLYGGNITIGDPPQNFRVALDTASSDTFIFDTQCGEPCNGRSLFDPTASSTSADTGEDFKLEYLDKSAAEGIIYNDTLTIGAVQVTGQTIGGATSFTGPFDTFNFPLDGVLGLGFPKISSFGKRSVFDTMIAQGAVDHPVFGFKFTDTAGEFDLGAVNPDLYIGEFAIANVTQGTGYWQIKLDAININGQDIVANVEAIIATDTAYTYVSPDIAKSFHDQIPGSAEDPDAGEGMYRYPCDSQVDVTFTFAGTGFPYLSRTFNGGAVSEGSTDCLSTVVGSGSSDVVRVGVMFLQSVYTVFSRDPAYVGFATLR